MLVVVTGRWRVNEINCFRKTAYYFMDGATARFRFFIGVRTRVRIFGPPLDQTTHPLRWREQALPQNNCWLRSPLSIGAVGERNDGLALSPIVSIGIGNAFFTVMVLGLDQQTPDLAAFGDGAAYRSLRAGPGYYNGPISEALWDTEQLDLLLHARISISPYPAKIQIGRLL